MKPKPNNNNGYKYNREIEMYKKLNRNVRLQGFKAAKYAAKNHIKSAPF
jgi:hypothetical protein